MIGYRDRKVDGAHPLCVDGLPLSFGDDGVVWNPTAAQERALTRHALRIERFERIEQPDPVQTGSASVASDEGQKPEPINSGRRRGGRGDGVVADSGEAPAADLVAEPKPGDTP